LTETIMPPTRRSFLKIAGSSAVILAAAGAGAAGFVLTRTPSKALAPWALAAEAGRDPRIWALSHAILAPNPHNRQPWLVDLVAEDGIVLYCDPERLLPATDPFNRQIVIGLGCFLELLAEAAAERGFRAEIEPFPDGASATAIDGRAIARIRLVEAADVRRDPLFAQVYDRRSNKQPFDTDRPVGPEALATLQGAAGGFAAAGGTVEAARVAGLRDLSWRAWEVELTTPRTYLESVHLMRIGKAEIEANPDGIALGGAFLEALNKVGVLTRDKLADPTSSAYRQGLDMYRPILGSAMGHVWLTTEGDSRAEQLDAGRAWVRINLKATELGLGLHPLSQALQEYPEMAALRDEIHRTLGAAGRRVQMFGRIGHGRTIDPSPRWRLRTRMRRA